MTPSLKNDSSHKDLLPTPECNHLTMLCDCNSNLPTDEVSGDNMKRLQAHFNLCNSVECPVCQLFGEGVSKLAEAVKLMFKTTITVVQM